MKDEVGNSKAKCSIKDQNEVIKDFEANNQNTKEEEE